MKTISFLSRQGHPPAHAEQPAGPAPDDGVAALGVALQSGLGALTHAVCVERRSAVVLCEEVQAMDMIGRELARMLRRWPDVRLQAIQSTGIESLLTRFNEAMERVPLDQACRGAAPDQGLQLWVLRLTRPMELAEVRLLLNLVQNFPGVGIRLLLLCSREGARDAANLHWSGRIHRWLVPTMPAVQDLPAGAAAATAALPATAAAPAEPGIQADAEPQRRSLGAVLVTLRGLARLRGRSSRDELTQRAGRQAGRYRGRWLMGLGGVLVTVTGALASWWQMRPDGLNDQAMPVRPPVPEIVELLEDSRPRVLHRESNS